MRFSIALASAAILGALAVNGAAIEKRDTHKGSATFYYQNGNPGSCGDYNSDEAKIIAVPSWMGTGHCGKKVTIQRGGKKITAKVADSCPTCDGYHIDLSKGAFEALASLDVGQMDVQWWF